MIERTSNTEKLAGLIIKILKIIGIAFFVFLIIDIIFILYVGILKSSTTSTVQSVEMICTLNGQDYIIEVGSDGYFNCSNCSKEVQKELKNEYTDFRDIPKTSKNIENYFINHKGKCE